MVDSRRGSLLLTIVQAARLSLTTAAFCGLALSAVLIGIAAQPGSARAASVTAALVKDINPAGSSGPLSLTDVGGTVFFFADDGIHGRELWKSGGTEAGTVMVKNINPNGSSHPGVLTDVGGTLFFVASDGTHGFELWKSDGTKAGTVMVKDVNPDGSSSSRGLADVEGTLFFSPADGTHGRELWKSNGTRAGTVMVKDVNPCGSSWPKALTDVGGTLFFSADDGIHGRELWRTSPISPPDPSGTTLAVRKSLQRLSARGEVSPNHACKRVIVTLQKKENGTFVKITRKRPALDARSHYRVGLERPAGGRCRIITRFPGDDDHLPSSARSTFYC